MRTDNQSCLKLSHLHKMICYSFKGIPDPITATSYSVLSGNGLLWFYLFSFQTVSKKINQVQFPLPNISFSATFYSFMNQRLWFQSYYFWCGLWEALLKNKIKIKHQPFLSFCIPMKTMLIIFEATRLSLTQKRKFAKHKYKN